MSRPVFTPYSCAPWDEPDVATLRCECGETWEEHINPDGKDKCEECKGEGMSTMPDTSVLPWGSLVLFGADREYYEFLACPHCDDGIVKTHCVDGCDCTRFVERGARTLIGMSARQAAWLEL